MCNILAASSTDPRIWCSPRNLVLHSVLRSQASF